MEDINLSKKDDFYFFRATSPCVCQCEWRTLCSYPLMKSLNTRSWQAKKIIGNPCKTEHHIYASKENLNFLQIALVTPQGLEPWAY